MRQESNLWMAANWPKIGKRTMTSQSAEMMSSYTHTQTHTHTHTYIRIKITSSACFQVKTNLPPFYLFTWATKKF